MISIAMRFRLLTEPASLKQATSVEPVLRHREFPAPHRAGLIEATPAATSSKPQLLFPAPHRAGLIEARPDEAGRRLRHQGVFPAPHRAGLIEAE